MKPLTMICAIFLAVILFTLSQGSAILHAQEKEWQPQPLMLRKGDQSVVIPVGDWVVAVDTSNRVIASGKLIGLHNGELITLNYKVPRTVPATVKARVPLNHIHTLYHGEARRVGYYFGKRCGQGILFGAALGSLLGSYIAASDESAGPSPMVLMPILLSAVSAPIGGVIGLAGGTAKAKGAIAYPLGVNEWHIEKEVTP